MKKIIILIVFFIATGGYALDKINVVVSIPPLVEMTKAVGQDRVSVTSFVTSGANPHTFEPAPQKLKEVSQADIFVKLGSGIEYELMWLDKLASLNRKMVICNSSRGIKIKIGADPHIWTSLGNAGIMVKNIKECLQKFDSKNSLFYERNAAEYLDRLWALNRDIAAKLKPLKNRCFLIFHPAWAYFADDYQLREIPLEIEGKEPKAAELALIIETAQKEKIKVIFVSPQFSQKSARVIARQLKIPVVVSDNLAPEYLKTSAQMAEKMVKFLQ